MKHIPLVDLQAQYQTIKEDIDNAINTVVASGQFILGHQVEAFEREFASYCGVRFCVGLDNGSTALEFGLRALGIGQKDEVITPVNSFIASSSAVSFVGGKPMWVDCDTKTYTIDVAKIERHITKRTKAIMPVHLYGQPANMDEILKISRKHNLHIIEDACQSHGAVYKGKKVGSFGDVAAFSFYPGKNLGCYGDGGALVTDNKRIYKMVLHMRNYGQSKKYHHDFLAWNRRLDALQAAVLRVKLKKLNAWNKKRRDHARLYTKLLVSLPIITPFSPSDVIPVYHLYVIRVEKRDKLQKFLSKKGIETGVHYPVPINLQKAYNGFFKKTQFSVSQRYAKELLSLPMYPELTEKDIQYIVQSLKEFFNEKN